MAPKKSKPVQEKEKAVEVVKEAPLDPVAEKLRQQRYEPWKPLVEEADYKNTAELFASKKDDDKTIDNFIPKSESDFLQYAQLISNKFCPFEHVMRLLMTSLKAADAKEVASSVTAVANKKLKAEKEVATGKKKTGEWGPFWNNAYMLFRFILSAMHFSTLDYVAN
ncbi:putative eukaryotic translation initiation factor 3 subunit J [Helianthus annuus]|uniref:Eukaryotic translation initiation factor 3 subunit J n=1 Tax=Helianthus annuus TaxID=4232 RepID=A0A251UZ22_HELAN|nr:putative eukaryotic translation initiation factor 3 subunit J [Helianthus annuus]KAJ0588064.1 putative eukaryotic translation initiation factor 3 subunit J [Helianthus annuus]